MISQVSCVGLPSPKTWDDYVAGCLGTFGGGYQTEAERGIFRHGMSTVFNLLRHEFPPAEQCKAAPELLAACEAAIRYDDSLAGRAARGEVELSGPAGIASGDDLDALYLDWMTKARAAIAKAKGAA